MTQATSEQPHRPLDDRNVRPVVARSKRDNSLLWFVGALVIGAALLFQALTAHRRALTAPAVAVMNAAPEAIPTLYVPPPPPDLIVARPMPAPVEPQETPMRQRPSEAVAPPAAATSSYAGSDVQQFQSPPPVSSAPLMAFGQAGSSQTAGVASPPSGSTSTPASSSGEISDDITNPSATLVQGTLIAAVLETGLDSSRPGQARALVSRDVRSFDGSTVLIPRGSRLYGDYHSDMAAGQRRALILWSRLLLPDGRSIALDSPVTDPLGRAGVSGSVNTHFLQRFAGTILQSTLDLGVGLATSRLYNNQPILVALPGTTNTITSPISRDIPPTIKVKPGARISVFVAHDLNIAPMAR